jgi:hypothetical protein
VEEALCSAFQIWLDQEIDSASGCLHSCMHLARLRGDTMEACVHCMLYCSADLVWTSFALRTLA